MATTGWYDWLSTKKNEISGQKYAFVKPTYSHNYYQDWEPNCEKIDHQKAKMYENSKKFTKKKDNPGTKMPEWFFTLKSITVTGIGEDNQV